MSRHLRVRHFWRLSIPLAATLALAACSSTQSSGTFRYSGFLKDYSMLEHGVGGDRVLAFYIAKDADFARYDAVILEPITIWRTMGSNMPSVSDADLEQLANYLWVALAEELQKDYVLAERPGRKVMVIRAALTEARKGNTAMDVVSTVGPIMRSASAVNKMVTGTQSFVGEAGIELEVVDSLTRERLAAAIDERSGGKTLGKEGGDWADAKAAFDHWAMRLRAALATLSGREEDAG